MARKFARSLQQQLKVDKRRESEEHQHMYKFDDEEVVCAEIAGLCHDLGVHLLCYVCNCDQSCNARTTVLIYRTWSTVTHI